MYRASFFLNLAADEPEEKRAREAGVEDVGPRFGAQRDKAVEGAMVCEEVKRFYEGEELVERAFAEGNHGRAKGARVIVIETGRIETASGRAGFAANAHCQQSPLGVVCDLETMNDAACDLGGLLQRVCFVRATGLERAPAYLGRQPAPASVGVIPHKENLDVERLLIEGADPYGQAVIGRSIVMDMHDDLGEEAKLDASLLSKS